MNILSSNSSTKLYITFLLIVFSTIISNTSFAQSSTANNLLRLRLYNNSDTNNFSEIAIRHGVQFSDGFDNGDIAIFPSSSSPTLFSLIDTINNFFLINSTAPLINDKTIRVGLYTYLSTPPPTNNYTLFANDLTAYTGTSMIFLIDSGSVPPIVTNLKTTPKIIYSFTNQTYLPFRYTLKIYPQATAIVDGCNDPNELIINNPASLPISYSLKNINSNNIITSATNFLGTTTIPNLSVGTYVINYTNSFNLTSSDTIVVSGLPFGTSILTPDTTINVYNPYLFLTSSSVSSSPGATYNWDFGDGTSTFGEENPFHLFPYQAGEYQVVLTANSNGCISRDTIHVIVNCPGFNATISSLNPVVDINNPTVNFTSIVSNAEPTATYNWSFGDGIGSSNSLTPNYTYPSIPGTYMAHFVVDNANGLGCVVSDSILITVTCPNTITNIVNSDTTLQLTNLTMNFSSVTSNQSSIATYTWNFDDGSGNINVSATNHTFPTILGNYTVQFTVDNGVGCIISDSIIVNVVCPNTLTNIINSSSILIVGNTLVNLQATANNTMQNAILTWDLGDGIGSAFGLSTTYTYPNSANTYQVMFTVNNGFGCLVVDSITIDVVCPNTLVNILTPDTILQLNNLNLNLEASFSNALPNATYSWDFGDGIGTSTDTITNYNFLPDTGSYKIKFTINNGYGCSVSDSIIVIIGCPNSTLNITTPNTTINLTNLILNLTSTSTNSNPSGIYNWTIGNGAGNAVGSSTNYIFPPTIGTYNVLLTLNNGSGCPLIQDSIEVIVQCPNTIVQITNIDTVVNLNNPSIAFNLGISNAISNALISWDFGNSVATGLNPTNTFPSNVGNYPVYVTVDNGSGCIVSDSITVVVDLYTAIIKEPINSVNFYTSNDLLILNSENKIIDNSYFEIYNLIGEKVKIINVSNNAIYQEYSLHNLSRGCYLITLKTRENTVSKKIILN